MPIACAYIAESRRNQNPPVRIESVRTIGRGNVSENGKITQEARTTMRQRNKLRAIESETLATVLLKKCTEYRRRLIVLPSEAKSAAVRRRLERLQVIDRLKLES